MLCETVVSSYISKSEDDSKKISSDAKGTKQVSVSGLSPVVIAWFPAPKFDPSKHKSSQAELSDAEVTNLVQKLLQGMTEGPDRDAVVANAGTVKVLNIRERNEKELLHLLQFFPNLRR